MFNRNDCNQYRMCKVNPCFRLMLMAAFKLKEDLQTSYSDVEESDSPKNSSNLKLIRD
jgi:hypothetical protein